MNIKYKKYYFIILAVWTLLMLFLIIFEDYKINQDVYDQATLTARSNFNKDQAIRHWIAARGGVYVKIDSTVKPNPALSHVPERDITTSSGKKLTLIDPAFMIRSVNEYFKEFYGIEGHITSTKLLRQANKPDKWELKALKKFETGEKEVTEMTEKDGKPVFRLMQPMITEKACLKCHAEQAYEVGEIRGGVSVSVPIKTILHRANVHKRRNYIIFSSVWLLGLLGLHFSYKKIDEAIRDKNSVLVKLSKQNSVLHETGKKQEEQNAEYEVLNSLYNQVNEKLRNSLEKVKESEAKFKIITRQTAEGIALSNNAGDFVFINPAFCKMTGYTREELLALNIKNLNSGSGKFNFDRVGETGKRFVYRIDLIKKNGKTFLAEITAKSIKVGKRKLILGTVRDITKQIEDEQELIRAKEKAEESNLLKTEFIHNMSHEIRTPMNGIVGFSEFLSKENLSPEKRTRYVKLIQSCSRQLLRIIDDILEISRLSTKQVKVIEEEVNLNNFLLDIFSVFESKAKTNGTPLYLKKGSSDAESKIITDKAKLHKILSNLVENAIKYTHEGFIDLGYRLKQDEVVLYVKDTGVGIKKENIEIIFDRFSQEDYNATESKSGLGLGLSIAKENTDLLGGKIIVESEKGEGSTFFIILPYKTIESENKITSFVDFNLKPIETQQKYKILIAEDEEVNFLYLEHLLKDVLKLNVEIFQTHNGKETVALCKETGFDIILMDLKMPVMDGFEATKQIRNFDRKVKIIAQTAYSVDMDKKRAFDAGCDEFISKPIKQGSFAKIISQYIA